jgi:hypothetical protein
MPFHVLQQSRARAVAPVAALLLFLACLSPTGRALDLRDAGVPDPGSLCQTTWYDGLLLARPDHAARGSAEWRPVSTLEIMARAWRPVVPAASPLDSACTPLPPQGRSCRVLLHLQHRLVI